MAGEQQKDPTAGWGSGVPGRERMGKNKPKAARQHAPEVRKTIFQLLYKPRLQFYDLLMSAASRLDQYEDWQTNRLNVELRDYEAHCSVTIDHTGITYEQDPGKTEVEAERIEQLLQVLPPALEVSSFIRFGYRHQYLIPVSMEFESLVSVMDVKFLSQDERLRELMPSKVEDLLYRVDAKEENHRYHVHIGPVRKAEVPQYIVFNRPNHLDPKKPEEERLAIIGQPPDVAVFIDIDLFRDGEGLSVKDAHAFREEAPRKVHHLATDIGSYVLSTTLDD